MADLDGREDAPLLRGPSPRPYQTTAPANGKSHDSRSSSPSLGRISEEEGEVVLSRSVEDDVLPETSTLGRTLSWQSAYILVISRVIGSGIFATPGAVLRAVGSPGLALTLWVVGGLTAACGLAVSLELGCMLPRSGGDKVYLEFAYRRPRFLASTLVVFHVVLLGFTASNCIVFSEYVLFAAGAENPSDGLRKGLAVALLSAVTIVHGCFRRAGVAVQNALGWLKVGLVIFMILSGLYAVVAFGPEPGGGEPGLPSLIHDPWQGSVWNWGVIATALFKVFYSFAGLENANNVLNEVRDPVRTLRSVSLTALATSALMYLLINLAYLFVVPVDVIKSSGELVGALFLERVFGHHLGGRILPLAIALSAAGNVMVVAFAMARVKQEIARQGFLPFSRLLSSTKPFGSPLGGFVVHYVPSFLVIVLPPSRDVYSFILEVEGYPGQLMALAVSAGLIWLRWSRPDIKRPFKAWLPAVSLRILLSLALLAAPFIPPDKPPESGLFYATYAIVGASIIFLAVVYWLVLFKLVPAWRGYRVDEATEVLDDGTSITKLVHVPL